MDLFCDVDDWVTDAAEATTESIEGTTESTGSVELQSKIEQNRVAIQSANARSALS